MINKALAFALKAHQGQTRKGTSTPYIVHPLEVGLILAHNAAAQEVIISGILHDTLEDTDVGVEEIRLLFGKRKEMAQTVLDIVCGVTEPEKLAKKLGQNIPGAGNTWLERKRHKIDYLKDLDAKGRFGNIKLVACADKLSNIKSMLRDFEEYETQGENGNLLWQRFNCEGNCSKQKWYYSKLVDSLSDLREFAMYQEFSEVVNSLFSKPEVLQLLKQLNE